MEFVVIIYQFLGSLFSNYTNYDYEYDSSNFTYI